MKCPACNLSYRLTWADYLKEPRGHHTCPQCRARFRLKYSAAYLILAILGCALGGVPLALVGAYAGQSAWPPLAGWVLGALLTGLPIDRLLDDGFRASVPVRRPPGSGESGPPTSCKDAGGGC